MTIRAQEIMDTFYSKYPDILRLYVDNECIADVLRYVADRLCTDLGELECPIQVLREIADELEEL